MQAISLIARLLFVSSLMFFNSVHAGEKASPEEVLKKVKEAAEFLSKAGEAGIQEFADREGRWVWKDTYVWVLKCDEMTDAAHPINPKLVGKNLAGMRDIKGTYLFAQLCEQSKDPKGGWIEYWWPRVNEKQPTRKISFVLAVPDTPYQVAAGIYDEEIPVEILNALLK